MTKKKKGRPRKFDKDVFLEMLSKGLSRKNACLQMRVSGKTPLYHLGRDKRFKSQVKVVEGNVLYNKYKSEIEKIERKLRDKDALFEKCMEPGTKDPFKCYLQYESEAFPDVWGEATSEILKWWKWARPDEKWIFKMLFLTALRMETKVDEEYLSVVDEIRDVEATYCDEGDEESLAHALIRPGKRLRKVLISHRPHYAKPSDLPKISDFTKFAEELAQKYRSDHTVPNSTNGTQKEF
jgi:hypothetical protein